MQPRSNLGGIARQPFRPGQWQGFKGVSRNTTYIQNNFYGSSVFGANRNYGYYTPQPSYHQCDGGGDMPKWMKWMVGLGMGSSLLGGILKLFQKDEQGGDTPTIASTQPTMPTEATTPTTATTATTATTPTEATTATTPTTPGGDGGDKSDYSGLNSLNNMICRDNSGKTANIAGDFKITEEGADGEPPKSFTITDSSSGTAHEYTYELTGMSDDGKPIYTCKSMNGQTASKNAYTLEMKGKDGKPELVQYDNQQNYGTGLKFGQASNASSVSKEASVPSGWYRADTNSNEGKNLALNECTSATEVLNKLLQSKCDWLSDSDRADLVKTLISANPSVFSQDGKVKPGADFDKLDVPSINYIRSTYVDGNVQYNEQTGTANYKSKVDGKDYTNNSQVAGAGGQTVRGQNGYYYQKSNSGVKYYDPKGNEISAEEFKKWCPNMYNTSRA
ncbi:hypothetical protein IAC76_03635 [Spirochaetes bacterium]|uniref:Uncharacterized protein n=1 Tax=Candidatus Scatousia excrementipullorum TaxID=2840936 RepID=A0A9D9DPK6_9BACT|nr:hypothetical protein [Candidatus Scatousia excrementipullorum]